MSAPKFAPGLRGGHYSKPDDSNMQIEQVGREFFLDKWAGGGWKNIAVFKTLDLALQEREKIASAIQARPKQGGAA